MLRAKGGGFISGWLRNRNTVEFAGQVGHIWFENTENKREREINHDC